MTIYSADLQPVHPVTFLWALPALPAGAAAVLALAGRALERRLGRARGAAVMGGLAVAAAGATAGIALAAALGAWLPRSGAARLLVDARGLLVDVGAVSVSASLALEPFSAVLLLAVALAGVGAQVAVAAAASGATAGEAARAPVALSTCLAGALLVLLADNCLLALVGWEALAWGAIRLALDAAEGARASAAGARASDTGASAPDTGASAPDLSSDLAPAPDREARAADAFAVNRVGQVAWLAGVVLLLCGLAGAAGPEGPRGVLTDVRGAPGAAIDLRTLGDRPHAASLREIPVGPTLASREITDQLALRDALDARPVAEALGARQVGPFSLLLLVCLGFSLGGAGLAAAIAVARGEARTARALPPAGRFVGRLVRLFVRLFVGTTTVAAAVGLVARFWFLFALRPAVEGAAAVVALAAIGAWVFSRVTGRSVVASSVRRALREYGALPVSDFARAAAWLDRRVLGPAARVVVLAAFVALAILLVRR